MPCSRLQMVRIFIEILKIFFTKLSIKAGLKKVMLTELIIYVLLQIPSDSLLTITKVWWQKTKEKFHLIDTVI